MTGLVQRVFHPEWYHGGRKRPPFFEGWYFKVVDATERCRYAFIPGIFIGGQGEPSHSFIQVLDGITGTASYHRYPVDAFWAATNALDVRIGPNQIQLDRIVLDIQDDQRTISGELHFETPVGWPATWLSPGIMGPFAWVPTMECNHGVLGLDHAVSGRLVVDGREIDFTGGRGYIEKDWGRSFPAAWVWMQSNHFGAPGTSLTASIAKIPWWGFSFTGFIVGLWHNAQLYRFATYNGAKIEQFEVDQQRVRWILRRRQQRLEIVAERKETAVLRGPSTIDMGVRVPESLTSIIHLRLSERRQETERTLFKGSGRHAGLEVVGKVQRLAGQI